ncbi:hypothetical protein Y1Q_0021571 [Alligator mississippiensis]|uniref:Uncharacterized protein n=1 Tax=Alligator mississippiensis TaxID=8496 RepID=A0A151PB32_ALLMI|nr:hypothetical protein Y1Q_0021571 [Alligator mississippiensis]
MECQRLQSKDEWLGEVESDQEEAYREDKPMRLTDVVSAAQFQEAQEEEDEIQWVWEDQIPMARTPPELARFRFTSRKTKDSFCKESSTTMREGLSVVWITLMMTTPTCLQQGGRRQWLPVV